MSGQQKLNRVTRHNRVVAYPSKKEKRDVLDETGKMVVKEVQLYRIRKMR